MVRGPSAGGTAEGFVAQRFASAFAAAAVAAEEEGSSEREKDSFLSPAASKFARKSFAVPVLVFVSLLVTASLLATG